MGPPLQHQPSTFTEAAKAACRAAWNVSEVAWTLLDNAAAATSPPIKDALTAALDGCHNELSTLQQEAEQVALRVRTAAGVWWLTDQTYGYDGSDYDTRHNRQPVLFEPWPPLGLYTPLPGE